MSNQQQVEKLLTNLENASHMKDMEERTRELRFLEEFDLISNKYEEDLIKRTFLVSLFFQPILSQIHNVT